MSKTNKEEKNIVGNSAYDSFDSNKECSPDIFDRIMHTKPFSVFESFYVKNKSVLLYLFFGGLTTLVSIFTFWLAGLLIRADFDVSILGSVYSVKVVLTNAISWICAVLFAFFTNRIWVFNSPTDTWKGFFKQMTAFFGGRFATFLLETAILIVFVSILNFNEMIMKIIAQIAVLISNYIISKLIVFKKRDWFVLLSYIAI